jgi:tape measure domain-containing protein
MADGQVDIDFVMNTDKFVSDSEKIKDLLNNIGDGAGESLDDNMQKASDKAVDDAKEAKEKIDGTFSEPTKAKIETNADMKDMEHFKSGLDGIPKEKLTKLLTQAKDAGLENFESVLDKMPHEKVVELVAKANDDEAINFKDLVNSVPKKHTTEMNMEDHVSSTMDNMGQHADMAKMKMGSFSDMLSGMVIGNVAYGALMEVQMGLGAVGSQAISTSDSIYTFQQTMKLGGFGSREIDSVTKKMKTYADDTVYDLQTVANTTSQLASNGVKNYESLTEAAGNLNAQAGGNADTFQSVALVMTQTAGLGKLNTENWDQLANAIPGASGVLKKAMKEDGDYTGDFNTAMENGQISSTEFFNAIQKLGSTDGAEKAAKSTKTFTGAVGDMEANVTDSIDNIIDAIGKNNLTKAIGSFGDAVSKAFDGLAGLIKYFKEGSTGAQIWMAALKGVGAALGAFGSILAVSKIISALKGAFTSLFAVLTGNPIGIAVDLIVGLGVAFYEAYKHVKPFHDAVGNLVSSISSGFKTAYKFVKSLFDVLTGGLSSTKRASGNTFLSSVFPDSTMTKINKFANNLQSWVKNVGKDFQNFGRIVTDVFKIFTGGMSSKSKASGFTDLSKILPESTVQKIGAAAVQVKATISKLFSELKSTVSTGLKFIEALITAAFNILKPIWKTDLEVIKAIWTVAWSIIKASIGPIFNFITTTISNALKVLKNIFKLGTDLLKGNWSSTWNDIKALTSSVWSLIKGIISGAFNVVIAIFKGAWSGIKSVATGIWNSVKGIFSALGNDIRNIWNGIKTFLGNIFQNIWDSAVSKFNSLKSSLSGILDAISSKWHDMWNGVSSFFSGIWKDIKGVAKSGINGVIGFLNGGIDGVDTVVHFFGGSKKAISDIPKLAKGSGPVKSGTPAIVNDEQASDFREAILRKDGSVDIPNGRNVLTYLDEGDSVVPAAITKSIFGNIPQYAGGTGDWLGKLWSGTKSFISSATDKAKAIADAIAHPLKTIKGIFSKVTNSAKGVWNTLASSAGGYLANNAVNWFKKTLSGLEDAIDGDAGGTSANPSGSGVKRWTADVKKALAANGLSTSDAMVAKVLRQIATESGGNPHAKQPGSDPDGDGSGPALGLMQTKRSTFNANKFPGHGSIFNGYDNLLAALRYAKKRYGSSLSYLGRGHGYAFGGSGDQEGLYRLFEGNQKEFIVPNPSVAGVDRSYAVLGQAAAYLGTKGNMQSNNSSALENAINKLVSLQSAANTKLEKSINKKVQVVLDSGKLVGSMYSKIDQKGYDTLQYQQRNVWG